MLDFRKYPSVSFHSTVPLCFGKAEKKGAFGLYILTVRGELLNAECVYFIGELFYGVLTV